MLEIKAAHGELSMETDVKVRVHVRTSDATLELKRRLMDYIFVSHVWQSQLAQAGLRAMPAVQKECQVVAVGGH
jgi:hypothetical protein